MTSSQAVKALIRGRNEQASGRPDQHRARTAFHPQARRALEEVGAGARAIGAETATGQEDATQVAMKSPYGQLIESEVTRAEQTLSELRQRALALAGTFSGIVTILVAVAGFSDNGVNGWRLMLVSVAVIAFLSASVYCALTNQIANVNRPGTDALRNLVDEYRWDQPHIDDDEKERVVAKVLVEYLQPMRNAGDKAGKRLQVALSLQVLGTVLAGGAAVAILAA